MRRIATFLIALLATCAGAERADAWTPPPTDVAARLARFMPIARAAWPGSPCAGREVVHLGADALLAAEAPAIAGPGSELDGMAMPDTCEVWLSGRMEADTFCTVLVHELGHLAGREHTTIPGDVMNGAGDIDWPPCDRVTTPPPAVAVAEEVRGLLPPPRAAWRIACGARRDGRRRCVARRGESVRRFEVSESPTALTVSRSD